MTKKHWISLFVFLEICLIGSMIYAWNEGAYGMLGAILLLGTLIVNGVSSALVTLGLFIHEPHYTGEKELLRNRFAIGFYILHLLLTIPLIIFTLHQGSLGYQKSFG